MCFILFIRFMDVYVTKAIHTASAVSKSLLMHLADLEWSTGLQSWGQTSLPKWKVVYTEFNRNLKACAWAMGPCDCIHILWIVWWSWMTHSNKMTQQSVYLEVPVKGGIVAIYKSLTAWMGTVTVWLAAILPWTWKWAKWTMVTWTNGPWAWVIRPLTPLYVPKVGETLLELD